MNFHSKGPCGLGDTDMPVSGLSIFCNDVKSIVATVRTGRGIPINEAMQNANLIMCAPELLAALQALIFHAVADAKRNGIDECLELQNAIYAVRNATAS